MAKIRSIHPEACESPKLVNVSDGAERTLWRLLTHSDDEGRGIDNPKLLASKLYPIDDAKDEKVVDGHLWELVEAGMLRRYTVGEKHYYEVHDFEDWQKPRHRTPSKFPPPTEGCPTPTADSRTDASERPTRAAEQHHGVGGGEGGGVGGGEGKADVPSAPDPVEESFEAFWQAYPRHARNGKPGGGGDRKPALKAWRNLSERKRGLALEAVGHYRAWCESPQGEFPKHAATWLHAESWEQWQEPANVAHFPRDGPDSGKLRLPDGSMINH